jgi:LmbE family N-acetylglucosaminyl deacetylase
MKKNIFVLLLVFTQLLCSNAQNGQLRIIVFGAHPDDCDLVAGGTAIKFVQLGHKVKFVSLTNGDAGHQSMGGGALAKRRMAEANEAGKRFGVEYTVFDNHDGELMPTLENRLKVIREIRNWNADIVITHQLNDYHPDHRYTSILVQDASFMVIVPNIAPDTPPLQKNPVFLYADNQKPDIAIDIDDVIIRKTYAASAHESQFFEWLPWLQGTLEKVPKGKEERLKLIRERFTPPDNPVRNCLNIWYGEAHGSKVMNAESFQFCGFGTQVKQDDILKLFPMLKK